MAQQTSGQTAFVATFDTDGNVTQVQLPDGTIITEPTPALPEQPLQRITLRRVVPFDVLVWDELDTQDNVVSTKTCLHSGCRRYC